MTARHVRWALGGVTLALLALAVGPFVAWNNLAAHDLVGHLASATFVREHLFPSPFGWNPLFYCGAPQGQLYPPLLSWTAAALGFVVPVGIALKLTVAAAVLATPPALYACARAHGLDRPAALLAALAGVAYLALSRQELGGNFLSTFETGNLANALGLPLVLAYVAALRRLDRGVILPSVLLALVLLAHLVGGLVALLFLVVDRVVALRADPKQLARSSAHVALAFALAAFFCVPLVARMRFGASGQLSYDQYPTLVVETVAVYALFAAFFAFAPGRRRLLPVALTAAVLFVMRSFVFNDFLPRAMTIHLHRFRPYEVLFELVMLAALLERWLVRAPRLRWAALGLAAAGVLVGLRGLNVRGVPAQRVPPLGRLDERVLVVSSPESQVSDHALQHLVPMTTGNAAGKGLFIEAAANGRALVDLERLVATRPVRAWGIELAPPDTIVEAAPRAPGLLRHLGFGWVLANEPVREELFEGRRALGGGFTLYRVGAAPLVDVWRAPVMNVEPGAFELRGRAWFLSGGPLPVERDAPLPPPGDAGVRKLQRDPHGQWLAFDVAAEAPAPVLVRVTYHPGWRAFDGQGHALPIYRAAPHLMMVVAKGPVTMRFGPRALEWATGGLSAVAWLLVGAGAVASKRGRKRDNILRDA